MPRGRKPLDFPDTQRARIFRLICDHATDNATLPTKHVIYRIVVAPVLHISPTTFYYHFDRLCDEGYIAWNRDTGEVRVVQSVLTINDPAAERIVRFRI